MPEAPQPLGDAAVELAVEQGGQRHALDAPNSLGAGAMAHGRFVVPSLTPGPAVLHVHVEAPPFEPRDERIPIEVVAQRARIEGRHLISSSMSQYADDSDPQPGDRRIVVRARGRVLTGFVNELFVRVTGPNGEPWSGPITIDLVDGEFAERIGTPDAPVRVFEATTDRAGLAAFEGMLASEVVRLEVALRDALAPDTVLARRKLRLVSFAGAVAARADPPFVTPGAATEVEASGLSAKRPVFVDVFGPDGAWVGTFDPPYAGREPARELVPPDLGEGTYQLEAYHFTTQPGESTAVVRVQVAPGDDLAPLVARAKLDLDTTRVEKGFDRDLERAWLDRIGSLALDAEEDARLRRFVIGTLPPRVFGPPIVHMTRDRDRAAMEAAKRTWTIGLRIYMLGGGGLFLLAMTWLMLRAHAQGAATTLAELRELNEEADAERLAGHVRAARRAALWRGLGVVAVMAGGIILTVVLLENLLWQV
jgi:hypothetical protein